MAFLRFVNSKSLWTERAQTGSLEPPPPRLLEELQESKGGLSLYRVESEHEIQVMALSLSIPRTEQPFDFVLFNQTRFEDLSLRQTPENCSLPVQFARSRHYDLTLPSETARKWLTPLVLAEDERVERVQKRLLKEIARRAKSERWPEFAAEELEIFPAWLS